MQIFDDPVEFQKFTYKNRLDGKEIGLFATLGAIHKGHLSLVERAVAENDLAVSCVFVNPLHFPTDELYKAYPRDLEGDLAKLESKGIAAVLTPKVELMYPENYSVRVKVPNFENLLESSRNSALVTGIATWCVKLYAFTLPNRWYFGEKDVEQIALIRQLRLDLNWACEIVGCPAIRDADGLPYSSRNLLLSAEKRQFALSVTDAVRAVKAAFDGGERDSAKLGEIGTAALAERGSVDAKEYMEIVDPVTMRGQTTADESSMLVAAITVPPTRIIDSFRLAWDLPTEITVPVPV